MSNWCATFSLAILAKGKVLLVISVRQVQNVASFKFVPQHKFHFWALEMSCFTKFQRLEGADFVPELLFEGKQDMPSRAVILCGMLRIFFSLCLAEAATPHGIWKRIQFPTSYQTNLWTVSGLPMTFDFSVTLRMTSLCHIVEISVFEPCMYRETTYSLTTCTTYYCIVISVTE